MNQLSFLEEKHIIICGERKPYSSAPSLIGYWMICKANIFTDKIFPIRKQLTALLFLVYTLFPVIACGQSTTLTSHAISMYGDIKYGADFTHFEYVNPEAPKGGHVRLAAIGTYDSFNPFIIN